MPFAVDLTGQDLGGLVLTPGVYRFGSTAMLTGTLTLNFTGASNSAFVFQVGSALTTASESNVLVLGGDNASGVFWNIGGSATLGTGSRFAGNIIAATSILLNTGAGILCGRAIALGGSVTLDGNRVSQDCRGSGDLDSGRDDFGSSGFAGISGAVPEPASWAMLIPGFGATGAMQRRQRRMVTC